MIAAQRIIKWKKRDAVLIVRRLPVLITAAAAAGFFAGILLPELIRMGGGSYAGLISLYGLGEFREKRLDLPARFPYVAGVRLRAFLFLRISCYAPFGLFVHMAYLFWICLSAGILLSVFVLRQGGSGVLLFLCCMFPQWLFYLSALAREIKFLEEKRRMSYGACQPDSPKLKKEDRKNLAGMLFLAAAGTAAEVCVGLRVFQIFLQYL